MENKICIYAICKNESQFVEKWLESMSEADYIVVLDTGSEDNTYELLKNDKRVYRCEQKVIDPWRFDVARNESMKLIPKDANILFCTDLDELLEPGWAEELKSKWVEGKHIRGWYKYAWSHTEDGKPARIFKYDKIHSRDWYWTAPVHEYLKSDIEEYNDINYVAQNCIDFFDEGKIYLHHYPDREKSRGNYLPLLELRAEEDPSDYYGKFYLSHEYYYRGFYQKSIDTLEDILNNPLFKEGQTPLEKAASRLFMGDSFRALGLPQEAIFQYNLAIQEEHSYREPYLNAAEVCNEIGLYSLAVGYVNEALKNSYRHYNWLERDNSWNEQVYDILSISYFYMNEIEKSKKNIEKACQINPLEKRLQDNKEIIFSAGQSK